MIFKRKRKNLSNLGQEAKRSQIDFFMKTLTPCAPPEENLVCSHNFYDSTAPSIDTKEEKTVTPVKKILKKPKMKKRQIKATKRSKEESEYKAI